MSSQNWASNDEAGLRGCLNYEHMNIFVCNAPEFLTMPIVRLVMEMLDLSDA